MGKIALCNLNCLNLEDATYKCSQTVEIDEGFIIDVYDTAAHKPYDCEKQYDYDGCWAIPGLVDMHLHISMSHCMEEPEYYYSPDRIMEIAYENLLELRRNGVTVCRDMGSFSHSAEWIKYILRNDCSLPYMLTCGDVITYPKGHMHEFGIEIENKRDIDAVIELNNNLKANFIKVTSDPSDTEAVGRIPNPAFDVDILQYIAKCGGKKNMSMACHTYPSEEGVIRALYGGARTIEHAAPFDEKMGKKYFPESFYVPTFSTAVDVCGIDRFGSLHISQNDSLLNVMKKIMNKTAMPLEVIPESIEEWFNIMVRILPKAIQTNQLLCIGSDAGCKGTNFSTILREILFMCILGATNQQALIYATINPYKALGLKQRGKFIKGNIADFVILKDNPLTDIMTILHNEGVVCRGRVITK